jgi:Lrp/AsnC family transcriptional regulator, regulator for asnA, asnC and gidA
MMMDELDHEIIRLLQEDGRMQSAEMGRRLQQPVRTIRYRLKRLLENKTIKICTVVDPVQFGYNILADVLIETEAGEVFNVAKAAAALEEVSYVACATGDRDVSVQVLAPDIDQLYQFITNVLHKISGVRRTQTFLLPLKLKDVYSWYPPGI